MAITDWPEEDRPRERLIRRGPQALSDAELLAVFLRVGVAGKSAVDLGRDMVSRFGSLNGLFAAPLAEFSAVNGLGPAKFAQLQAVLELARRALAEGLENGDVLDSPDAVRAYLRLLLANRLQECFVVLFLDVRNRVIGSSELFRGTLTHASVYPREVVKAALRHNAAAVILAHNHPSGVVEPSAADRALTDQLKAALAVIDVRTLDHLVIGEGTPASFAERGWL